MEEKTVEIRVARRQLAADIKVPPGAGAIVLFVHGTGSSRQSPRNRNVAGHLNEGGIATVLLDPADRG